MSIASSSGLMLFAMGFVRSGLMARAAIPVDPLHVESADLADSDCFSTLQLEQDKRTAFAVFEAEIAPAQPGAGDAIVCEGPWCPTLINFSRLFDSNDPWQMQEAFDSYADFASREDGLKFAVTKDHFYEMYHGNVGRRVSEYMPERRFAWKFDNKIESAQPGGPNEATVARSGTITVKLGSWRRALFWNVVVKALPEGETFPDSDVSELSDCTKCLAKMVFTLKKGGWDGAVEKGWKITGLTLIKLE